MYKSVVFLNEYVEYREFIECVKNKKYSEELVMHKHHIIPVYYYPELKKDKNNIVRLSVDDHIQAHLLWAKCFELNSLEQINSLRAVRFLNKKSIKFKEKFKGINSGINNGFYGKNHSKETRDKLSKMTSLQFENVNNYEEIYGVNRSKEEKDKRSIGVKNYFENASIDELKKRSENISKSLK